MIITCNNCNKKFEVNSSVVPEKGRLLQCNGCKHKWFFKKEISNNPISLSSINKSTDEQDLQSEVINVSKIESSETIKLLDETTNDFAVIEKNSINNIDKNKQIKKKNLEPKVEKSIDKKYYNILSLIIVFMISFVALIVIVDTFTNPISKIFPNIEFLLYNLYETIIDIVLFLKDLI